MKLIVGLPLAAKQHGREAAWAGLSCMNRAGAGALAGAYIHEWARLVFIEASCWLQPPAQAHLPWGMDRAAQERVSSRGVEAVHW